MRRALGPEQYRAYIESAAWRLRKAWWRSGMRARRRRCRVCGTRPYDLHHRTYRRLGCERRRDLVPLCRPHHDQVKVLQQRHGWRVERATSVLLMRGYCTRATHLVLLTPAGWSAVGLGLLVVFGR